MIHICIVWDRTPESAYQGPSVESAGFIQTTSVSADGFFQDPHVLDSCNAVFLIGTVADSSFCATAKTIREHCAGLPLIITTTAEGMETGGIRAFGWDLFADLWIVRTPEEDVFSERLWKHFFCLFEKMPETSEDTFRKFKTIADHANYGIVITSPDATIFYANAWFAAMYGYSQDELIGKNISDLYQFRPADFADFKRRLFEHHHLELEELNAYRKDGSVVPTQA